LAQDHHSPIFRRAGFPEFTRFFSHDFSWKLRCHSHPLCRLSYRGVGRLFIPRGLTKCKIIGLGLFFPTAVAGFYRPYTGMKLPMIFFRRFRAADIK